MGNAAAVAHARQRRRAAGYPQMKGLSALPRNRKRAQGERKQAPLGFRVFLEPTGRYCTKMSKIAPPPKKAAVSKHPNSIPGWNDYLHLDCKFFATEIHFRNTFGNFPSDAIMP